MAGKCFDLDVPKIPGEWCQECPWLGECKYLGQPRKSLISFEDGEDPLEVAHYKVFGTKQGCYKKALELLDTPNPETYIDLVDDGINLFTKGCLSFLCQETFGHKHEPLISADVLCKRFKEEQKLPEDLLWVNDFTYGRNYARKVFCSK